MKKLLSLVLIASMVCSLTASAGAAKSATISRNVNIIDALKILMHLAVENSTQEKTPSMKKHILSPEWQKKYDFNNNNKIDIDDSLITLMGIALILDPVPTVEDFIVWEEKIYCNATVDQNFCGDKVLVVIDKSLGWLSESQYETYFGGFPKTGVKFLDSRIYSIELPAAVDCEGGCTPQKSCIKCKQNVLNVVAKLEKVDGIRSAGTDYIGKPGV